MEFDLKLTQLLELADKDMSQSSVIHGFAHAAPST